MRRYRLSLCILCLSLAGVMAACGGISSNTVVEFSFVNDQPGSTAQVTLNLCGLRNGQQQRLDVLIDATGKGSTRYDTADFCNVGYTAICGDGFIPNNSPGFLAPRTDFKRTFDCQFTKPTPSNPGWESFDDSNGRILRDQNPEIYLPYLYSSIDPYNAAYRESVARSFLAEHESNVRQANVLYDWLLRTTSPDGTVLQNLESGQTTESQIVYIVAGQQFFAASNNDYATFVTNAYRRLVDRDPTQSELDTAVRDLRGYWTYECDPMCTLSPVLEPTTMLAPIDQCCYRVWYRKTRQEFTWEILWSHEFHQVAARYMCGLLLRRVPTTTEIEDQAYYIGSYGLKEGAVRLLKGEEYFSKSTQPW